MSHSGLSTNGQQGEGKNRKLADARTRARGGFPSPHSFLHPLFVLAEKARCFSRIVVEYFRKVDELQLGKERLLL